LTLLLILVALAIAGAAIWQRLGSQSPSPQVPMTSNWATYAFPGNEIGPATAKVTVLEFSDFQCPYCAKASHALDGLREKYPNDLRIVFRHFPVRMTHEHAFTAAIASECAALQGRFKQYHDVLFANQAEIGKTPWSALADQAGIPDSASFLNCVAREQTRGRVEQDMDAARSLQIRGTPLLLVNGQHLMTGDSTQIRKVVEAALK
jgi:protein-disulfide isomerase